MHAALLIARLLLAIVFATACLGKALDLRGTRSTIKEFGAPLLLVAPLALLLPLAEAAIAVALVPLASARVAAIGALVLLALLSIAVAVNLAQGRRPDCHCFGALASEPIGASTLWRNVGLGALAAFVAAGGPGSSVSVPLNWLGGGGARQTTALVLALVLVIAVLLLVWLGVQLLRQNGRLLQRIEALEEHSGARPKLPQGLPVGTQAPRFMLPDANGRQWTLDALLDQAAGRPLTLLFSDPDCGACASLLRELDGEGIFLKEERPMAVITRAASEGQVSDAERRVPHVLVQKEYEVMEAYGVPGTPSSVLVLPDGTIGSAAALGADRARAMLTSEEGALGRSAEPNASAPQPVLRVTRVEPAVESPRPE